MRRGTLKAKLDACGRGQVFIDDKDISHLVSEFVVKSQVGGISTVDLHLIGVEFDLEVEAELRGRDQDQGNIPAPGSVPKLSQSIFNLENDRNG